MHVMVHLFRQLTMHESIKNDSIKGETEEACYAALEDTSEISLYRALKAA